jgi:hypothetical protein
MTARIICLPPPAAWISIGDAAAKVVGRLLQDVNALCLWGKHMDMLSQAIEFVRPMVADANRPTKERIHILWAAAKKSRDLGASDVVQRAFMMLAVEANLIDQRGYWTGADIRDERVPFGAQDVAHVIRWAMRGWNPFEKGPLT